MRRSSERCIETPWVTKLFAQLEQGDEPGFLGHVADNAHWTVLGSHPLAGVYESKQSLVEGTLERLKRLLNEPLKVKINHVLVAEDTAVIEMSWLLVAKSGKPFHNQSCWVARFESDMIVEARVYLDSALVSQLIHETETHSQAINASGETSDDQ